MRFVIARIDKGEAAVGLKPVVQGERRMIEVAAGNLDSPILSRPSTRLAIANCGAELLKGYGKVGRVRLTSQSLPQALVEAARPRRCPTQTRERKVAEKWGYPECGPSGCG